MKFQIVLIMLLTSAFAQAGENGRTSKSDRLRAAPFSDAATLATLPAGSRVEILKKDGGWFQVKTDKGNGWLRMLSLRVTKKTGSELSGLASLTTGRAGTGKIVSTTGIRGLNEEQLKAAKYDEKQVTLVESYTSSRAEAQKFANLAKLKSKQVDYLPAPASGD